MSRKVAGKSAQNTNAVSYDLSELVPEAAAMLAGWDVSYRTVRALKAMVPSRQADVAAHLVALGSCADIVVMPLLLSTPPEKLTSDKAQSWARVLRSEWMALSLAGEKDLSARLDAAERIAAPMCLELFATQRYFERILASANVVAWLGRHHPHALRNMRTVIAHELRLPPGTPIRPPAPKNRSRKRRRSRIESG